VAPGTEITLRGNPIPVPFPTSYSQLCILAVKGECLGVDIICPRCLTAGLLFFTSSWVLRGIIWHEKNGILIFEKIKIPLTICRECRGRFRVLPEEILPYKHFSLPAIEDICAGYMQLDPDGSGLRTYVDSRSGISPDHSTLHRWTVGIGERVLDRLQPEDHKTPFSKLWFPSSALVAESAKIINPKVREQWRNSFDIPSWKYRSARRHDQLQACARLFSSANLLFPDDSFPLTMWEGQIIQNFNVAGWWFPSGFNCTGLQHARTTPNSVNSSFVSKIPKKEVNYGSRSPPDGLVPF